MRPISLQDTLSGERRPLEPREPGRVGIYACGPTVYGRVHVGNARPFVVFSVLRRFLEHEGLDATLVVNVTDVNDKIYDAARAAGVASEDLAREMTAAYVADTDGLELGRPDHEPLASQTMGPIVALIGDLIASGHAYEADGDVYFRVRSYPRYGELSHRDVDAMDQGEGVEGAERKEDPLDFALWKARKEGEDTWWPAPWGEGRPGWHIECSAMAEELLGVGFEIHGGGSDLVFPHHENEAAQTGAARGEPLARLWMHNGMVQMGDEKMAKSVGNIRLLHVALEQFGRDALVMYFLGGHYRQPLAFSEELLDEAGARVERIRNALGHLTPGPSPAEMSPLKERFFAALAEDFNTPMALAAMFDWIREANRRAAADPGGAGGETGGGAPGGGGVGDADLREMLDVLGFGDLQPLAGAGAGDADPEALALLERRNTARSQRDYDEADRLRDEIRARGWEIRDGPGGAELIPLDR